MAHSCDTVGKRVWLDGGLEDRLGDGNAELDSSVQGALRKTEWDVQEGGGLYQPLN